MMKPCVKCNDRGQAITRMVTYCDIHTEGYPNLYAVRHWCDSYSSLEAKRYLHGTYGGIGPERLVSSEHEAEQLWNKMNGSLITRKAYGLTETLKAMLGLDGE